MAGMSLRGYENTLPDLTSDVMTDQVLRDHVNNLEGTEASARKANLGQQADRAARLLLHFRFEQAMRLGVSPAEFASTVSDDDVLSETVTVESIEAPTATR